MLNRSIPEINDNWDIEKEHRSNCATYNVSSQHRSRKRPKSLQTLPRIEQVGVAARRQTIGFVVYVAKQQSVVQEQGCHLGEARQAKNEKKTMINQVRVLLP